MIIMKNEIEESAEERNYCVYVHTSPSGKKYVGQTCRDVWRRWGRNGNGYMYKRANGEYIHPIFARAITKYGWDNFIHEVVKDSLTKEEADNLEKILIEELNTMNPDFGYNCKEGGSHGRLSEESRKKIGDSNRGRIPSEDTRKKMSDARKKRVCSEETKRKMSESQKGEKSYWYGKHRDESTKKKLSESLKGRSFSDETRKKMSEAQKGEKHPMYGKHHTEEAKEKMRMSHIGKRMGANNTSSRKASQYDMQGNLIRIWDCMIDASRELKIDYNDIYRCCKGDCRTAGGFIWRYYEDNLTDEHLSWCNESWKKRPSKRRVAQYSLSGELIQIFESMSKAESETGISNNNIRKCCKGNGKTAGGFIWKYYDDIKDVA